MQYDTEQVTDVLFCRIFFRYLGSLQMPHTWKQGPSLSCINTCIKRIQSEGREPISVSLEIHNNNLRLVNKVGNTIRVFPFHTLVYTGASTSNTECMVVVTRSPISEYSPQLLGGEKVTNLSHAFRIEPSESTIRYHGPAKAQKLMRNLDILEYPQDALRVLKTFVRIFELCTKYEPHLKRPRAHFDNATRRVILVDFRNNLNESFTSSEHSPFIALSRQHSSSDGSMTDNVSYTASEHSHKFNRPYENIITSISDTRLNAKIVSKSSTSLDSIAKHSVLIPKSGSHSNIHSPRRGGFKPTRKGFSESEPCLGNNLTHVEKWLESLDNLLTDPVGVDLFKKFLKTQFSAENLEFWLAVEKYKSLVNPIEIGLQKSSIFQRFIHENAPSQVNLEERLRREILTNMKLPDTALFNSAQGKTYHILRYDCYPRFKSCTILADYIQENRLASMKESNPPEENTDQKPKSSHSDVQLICPSNDNEKTHKHNKPLSFLRRSFNRRRNSTTKDNTPPLSTQSSEEFTFIRDYPSSDEKVYIHIPGRDKLSCKVNNSQTLREALHSVFQSLHISPDLYEFRQADTLNLIDLDQNSIFFSGKNILLQQHSESFTLTVKLPSHPLQEFILRTSNTKTILNTIQPILDIKGISKDSISLQLSDCNVPLQLDLGSSVLNKQKVELTRYEFESVKVKSTSSSNSPNNSPTRDPKQELLKTQYPNRKVNKVRNSQRNKKEKPVKTKEMLSLIESAQMNRMNDQRSTLERNLDQKYLPDKPPRMPTNSERGVDICPHTGETLFQAPNDKSSFSTTYSEQSPVNPHKEYIVLSSEGLSEISRKEHLDIPHREVAGISRGKEYIDTPAREKVDIPRKEFTEIPRKENREKEPPKYTPHKPTMKIPQNLAESKFQPNTGAYFAPNSRLGQHKYNVTPAIQQQQQGNVQGYKQMFKTPHQTSTQLQTQLPVTSIYPMQNNNSHQSIFYKGAQHLITQNSTSHHPPVYNEPNNTEHYNHGRVGHGILPTPSPFDECNLPSRMNFAPNPLPNFQPQNFPPFRGYKPPIIPKPDQKLTHTYSKPLHTPSYL